MKMLYENTKLRCCLNVNCDSKLCIYTSFLSSRLEKIFEDRYLEVKQKTFEITENWSPQAIQY